MTATTMTESYGRLLVAGVEASTTADGLRLRWGGRELTVLPGAPLTTPETLLDDLEALLKFCYDAGFADAGNPRLFVP